MQHDHISPDADARTYHQPVMLEEVLCGLDVREGGNYIDCTLGDAGHAMAILERNGDGRLLGLDADPEATATCRQRLARFGGRAVVVNANFEDLEPIAQAHGFVPADGVLFDLGLSSRQLDAEERGFSFRRADPLDMRFTPSASATAADIVDTSSEEELADILYQFGEEPRSRRIARAIAAARPIANTMELAEVVRRASGYGRGRTHPATRTFQALRIAVNREMERLEAGLASTGRVLAHGGRMAVIAYHSGEDRIVKRFLEREQGMGFRRLTKKVIKPSSVEVRQNRRARSARLRLAERV
ncbi:MAG: 16S rRNA (cytosine(1402)-N(4))-methyltransferase RsmH [SAR202 cluster bacterium]|nr:16S rRNA (cytosine(1402)-N(4))-methyltransferase RsmH [SAR202 cluster bacterium]